VKPFQQMTGPELAEAFNAMVDQVCKDSSFVPKHVKKFESLDVGITRCIELRKAIDAQGSSDMPGFLRRYPTGEEPAPAAPAAQPSSDPPIAYSSSIAVEADRRWRIWQPSPEHMTRPRRASFEREIREELKEAAVKAVSAPEPVLSNASRHRRADKIVRILVAANPRRPGTDAHKYFEAMKGGPTVGEYLAKFPEAEQRKAAQWLWNTCRDNFVKLLG
jgi:hypothetical protein